mgnify:CR=1 FL=1
MKKMLIAALCLLTLSGSAMAAQNVPKELQMSGTVTENTGSMITVKNSNKPFDSVALHITDNTYILQSGTGYYLGTNDVKKDGHVSAWYGPALTPAAAGKSGCHYFRPGRQPPHLYLF